MSSRFHPLLHSYCDFRDHFFMDLKHQIKRGDIHIPNPKLGIVGAHIAQVEMGDILCSATSPTVYPPYFSNWNSGISHIIRKEHTKLKGNFKKTPHIIVFIDPRLIGFGFERHDYIVLNVLPICKKHVDILI